MMNILLPFGKSGMELNFDPAKAEILESGVSQIKSAPSEDAIVKTAMANPIGSPKLCELAAGKRNCVIIISDHTRPVPSKHIIPFMLSELREGNPGIDISLLVATGFHRITTKEELIQKLGEDIVKQEKIIIHDSRDETTNTQIGILPSGAALIIDKAAANADLLLAEGFIEPHFFAGFSGGAKSVLPGICDQATVLGNHCSAFIDSPYARAGIIDNNPLQIDISMAAKLSHLAYIVNVIIDEDKKIVAAFAGDPIDAHRKGCEFLLEYCRVKPKTLGDIVISTNGGYPLDQNIYQSVKGLMTAESVAAKGAILIMLSACNDGNGSESFYEALRDCRSLQALIDEVLATPQSETKPDQWEYQILARIMRKHRVIYITESAQRKTVEDMKLEWSPDVQQALETAYSEKGRDAHLVILRDGISVIVA